MRRYIAHLFLAALIILLPSLLFAWWAEPISGDLTRVGRWTEHDFGPNAKHPDILIKASGRDRRDADVMALGDSFSGGNLWQSVFSSSTGLVVKSFLYESQGCIQGWIKAAVADRSTKIVIVQVVEREFVSRFRVISSCLHTEPTPLVTPERVHRAIRSTWPPTLSFGYLATSAINTAELNFDPQKPFKRFRTVNLPLRSGCARFSNRRPDRLLYYADDDLKLKWHPQEVRDAVSNVVTMQNEVERGGKRFVFVVAPDKSSVYRACLPYKDATEVFPDINSDLVASGVHAPDMLSLFRGHIGSTVDLYDPNNTHWGEAGYILAGNGVAQYVSERSGAARAVMKAPK